MMSEQGWLVNDNNKKEPELLRFNFLNSAEPDDGSDGNDDDVVA